jgi:hypothetical protein
MLLNKLSVPLYLFTFLISIYTVFSIKSHVINLKSELVAVNNQIQYELDTIHLLKAELAYLTSPKRLKALNDQYLMLTDTKIAQMDQNPKILLAEGEGKSNEGSNLMIVANQNKVVKWHFKKGALKYLTMAASKK